MPVRPQTFRPKSAPSKRQVDAEYDARRGSARARGYELTWEKESLLFRQEHPLCLGCAAIGLAEPASLVDHVIPHKGDRGLFWDKCNWQPACARHHDIVKQRLEAWLAIGKAKPSDMRLDSPVAIKLSREVFI
jgi:5-methylcytosine-specific restriction endonuclease McrA